jgi:dienelactone hydrolase
VRPSALGGYDDWPEFVRNTPRLTGDELTTRVAELLGVPQSVAPPSVRTITEWQDDGVACAELEWSTPFGPATRAWLLRPVDGPPGPGLLGLHCHSGVKSIGAERLVATPYPSAQALRLRAGAYGGRAVANELARAGFTVLSHDTFAWGSRRFDFDPMPYRLRDVMNDVPLDENWYDVAAGHHEHTIAKAAGLLGTSFAGMVAYDDLVALNVLRSMDVDRVGVFGLSGGGGRAAVLTALAPAIDASAVVCMMTTFAALIPAYLDAHSWLFSTPGLARHFEHPELAAGRAGHQQLVVYAEDDELFSPQGMQDAHALLTERFQQASGTYRSAFLPGGHRFDVEMQRIVEDFFRTALYT